MTGFESQMNKFNHTSISLGVQIEKLYSSDVDGDIEIFSLLNKDASSEIKGKISQTH